MKKIFIIGDSISIHYGPHLKNFVKGKFSYSRKSGTEKALKNLDVPMGANGGDSSMVRDYLQRILDNNELDTDFLLINCGLHDIKTNTTTGKRQIELEQYKENISEIVNMCAGKSFRLIWINSTPIDENQHNSPTDSAFYRYSADLEAYNISADEIMRKNKVPIINLNGFTANLEEDLYCDHVHYNEPVRKCQAAFISGWLEAFTQQ